MQSLFRRNSGFYVFRIAVPSHLRAVVGKREIILTTGSRDLAVAKLVANAHAAQWRQRFFDLNRLMFRPGTSAMDHHEILKISQGHPVLLGGGHLPLSQAATASGIEEAALLRGVADGRLGLFYRAGRVQGFLLPDSELELQDRIVGPAGGYVVPQAHQMPAAAVEHIGEAVLRIPATDLSGVTAELLAGSGEVELVLFEVPDRPGIVFAPNGVVRVGRDALEVSTAEVEALRRSLAVMIEPERLADAKLMRMAAMSRSTETTGNMSSMRFSEGLAAYVRDYLPHKITSKDEIRRVRDGIALFVELEGDLRLADVDAEALRRFRNTKLAQVPANENRIRAKYNTKSVTESIRAVTGTGWPIMSAAERDQRMTWIARMLKWLHKQEWIASNPAAALHGESVLTLAEKKRSARRDDENRDPFTDDDLRTIFSVGWFRQGKGEVTKAGTYREFCPHYYWLPLLAIYQGGRMNELCQLRLDEIGQTETGVWLIDFNGDEPDKRLKNDQSKRTLPLHPALVKLGMPEWHAALKKAGYTRLFPELAYDETKGYSKGPVKWFSRFMASLGYPRDGRKVFHSFRHNFTNALPEDTPERLRRQLLGHDRGEDVHDRTYRHDMAPEIAAPYLSRLKINLPDIAVFDVEAGLQAIGDALKRKNGGRGADEQVGKTS